MKQNTNQNDCSSSKADKRLTEVIFLLDRSGSMAGLETDTIGGFNSLLQQQRSQMEGDVLISTVLFDHVSEVLHDRVSIHNITDMTTQDYVVRGSTALLDAVGGAIHHIGNVHKYARAEDRPDKTLFVITTDGMENASRHYSYDKVKSMIERQQSRCGWEFLFLGANMDAFDTAGQLGIRKEQAVNFHSDAKGTALNYEVLSEAVTHLRCCEAPLSADWKKRIDEDYKARK